MRFLLFKTRQEEEYRMRKETDLEEVKRIASLFLWLPPHETEFSPVIVKHPFTDCGIVIFHNSQQETETANILESESALNCWREEMGKWIKQAESVQEIYPLVTKSYTFAFLKDTAEYLSQKDLSEILSIAWVSTECPNLDQNFNQRQKLALFKAADPIYLMDASEREKLESLEEEVTIYRGVTSYTAKNIRALSWTLDYETADWFAHRYGKEGRVYQARINKENIYALFNGAGEWEVIVDPQYLTELREAQEPEESPTLTQ
jgi:hypothetical protein